MTTAKQTDTILPIATYWEADGHQMTARPGFRDGDVLNYTPSKTVRREGVAVIMNRQRFIPGRGTQTVNDVVDTYWNALNYDSHVLSIQEIDTASVRFNVHDFRVLEHDETFADFHPDDRATIPSQHGLILRRFVRLGAAPDLETKIENAKQAYDDAVATTEQARKAETRAGLELEALIAQRTGA
ncbi:hypothetical protein ACFVAJ_17575 [Agromyces sp. NPDC057679]|uniref:hypothetical protein n=1 Tax=Agromyces sp. NPDC057679 TaxID=3346207 RepID=UPI00366CC445